MMALFSSRGMLWGSIALIAVIFLAITQRVEQEKSEAIKKRYDMQSRLMREEAYEQLQTKMHTTLALAISLVQDSQIRHIPDTPGINDEKYGRYLATMQRYTPLKNVWIEIGDEEGRVVYRSWEKVPAHGTRTELTYPSQPQVSLCINENDLLICAAVPMSKKGSGGVLRVYTHFNSIAKVLHKSAVDTLVLLNAQMSLSVSNPFTDRFVDGRYIANMHASRELERLVQRHRLYDECPISGYQILERHLFTGVALENGNGTAIGCMMLFKSQDNIAVADITLDAWGDKLFALILLTLLGMGFVVTVVMVQRRQKAYYKEIIDSSSNVIVVTDGVNILDVNQTFFRYASQFHTLEGFKAEYKCICDFFIHEEGFLAREMDGESWVEYVATRPSGQHIAKIKFNGTHHYFQVSASTMKLFGGVRYSAVFTDITREWLNAAELERLTTTDPLTQVKNRRYFDEHLQSEHERSLRYGHALSVAVIDIDHFKRINDTFGHSIGDKVLKKVCRAIEPAIRTHDRLCRIGGEEFAVIMPHTSCESAVTVAERIRSAIASADFGEIGRITVSIGVCQCDDSFMLCFEGADKALYDAKLQGRNRVESCG